MLPDDEGEAWKDVDRTPLWLDMAEEYRKQIERLAAMQHPQPKRKRPAELDDKDRKNPWGHIPYHN